jgi:tetratricopeptide (TPR) repeat protein
MFSRLISGDPRFILKSDQVIWLLLILLTSVIVFPSFIDSWGRNRAHIYLSKLIRNSPYSCVIINASCKNDSNPNHSDSETWRNLGIYLRNDPVLIIIPQLGEFADVDYYESEIATYSDRTDLAWLAFGVKAYQHELVNKAIESWENVPEISYYLINLSQNTDNMSLSIELLKLALDVQPSGVGYYELCNRLLENEQREAALAACQQALPFAGVEENLDLRAKIYMRLGDIFLRLGNPEDALNSYFRAQALIGQMPRWDTMRLAQAHFRLGHLDEASQILRDLLEENKDMTSLYWLLGEVERQRGNAAGALQAYREYQHYRPEDDRVYQRLKELEEK